MVIFLFIITHILFIVTCVRTHSFTNLKYENKCFINNELYKRNRSSYRIFSDSVDNNHFFEDSKTHISTHVLDSKKSHRAWYKELLKYFKHDNDVDYLNKNGTHDQKNDKCTINIISPPPNLTGDLHIGNLLNLVCSDVYRNYLILNRFKVNINFSNDHAGQSFQKLFDKMYNSNAKGSHNLSDQFPKDHMISGYENEGISEFDDSFSIQNDKEFEKVSNVSETENKLKLAHLACKNIRKRHVDDLKALGIDWPYGKFSMDEDVQELTKKVFIKFYQNNLLSERNWPSLANYYEDKIEPISSAEVEYKLLPKVKYTMSLPVNLGTNFNGKGSDFGGGDLDYCCKILISTTTPEYYYGTTGIGVSYQDYERLNLKKVYLPKINREVPIVPLDTLSGDYRSVKLSDSKEGGTGNHDRQHKTLSENDDDYKKEIRGVLIIPAHVENDFWIAKKYGLDVVNILNINGKLQNVPLNLLGCSLNEGLGDVMELFKPGEVVKVNCAVNMFDGSTKVVTLPILHYVLDSQKLVEEALRVFEGIKVVPESRKSMLRNRLNDIRNWCISRHGWWGIRLPIYYLYDDFKYYKILALSRAEAEKKAEALTKMSMDYIYSKGYRLKQDKRVLDTWFTSSLWPILSQESTFTEGLENTTTCGSKTQTHKNRNILFTCYDILETWVVKMLLICSSVNKCALFDEVYLHGMVSDGHGKKMSKSLNNTVVLNQLIRRLNINLSKFDSSHFETEGYFQGLVRDACDASNFKKLNDVELLVKTNLIRLKLSGMCKCSDFTNNYDENDRSLYILTKYYQIFKFYNNLLAKTNSKTGTGNTDDNNSNATTNNSDSDQKNSCHNQHISYIECIIGSKLKEYTSLIDKNLKTFQLSNCILYLEHLIKTFSDYLVPFIRLTVVNRLHDLKHFDRYFVNLKSILYPFIPRFVDSFLLNEFTMYDMAWPSSESDDWSDHATVFDEFEKLLNGLRRDIINSTSNNANSYSNTSTTTTNFTNNSHDNVSTSIRVNLPSKLYSEFTMSFINYLIQLTFNKIPSINYIKT